MNDRTLRDTFDITAASEVMAVLAIARDLRDLRGRLGRITVAHAYDGSPVTAEDVGAAGAMTVLLKAALRPNLIQTIEGQPALVHAGPFANLAHGNNSLIADALALRLADYVVTESGFGADMGFEKLVDIVCRLGELAPSAVVLVATVRALKHHGGDAAGGADAMRRSAANLARHIEIVRRFGSTPVVAVDRFADDSDGDVRLARALALEHGALAAEVSDAVERGGDGALALAEAVAYAASDPQPLDFIYELDDPIAVKIERIATRVYGASGVSITPEAERTIAACEAEGLGSLPVCMAKTPLSLSHDPTLINSPHDFVLPVPEARRTPARAGWLSSAATSSRCRASRPSRRRSRSTSTRPDGRSACGDRVVTAFAPLGSPLTTSVWSKASTSSCSCSSRPGRGPRPQRPPSSRAGGDRVWSVHSA